MLARPKKEGEIQPEGWKYISAAVTKAGIYRPCQNASKTRSPFREFSALRGPVGIKDRAEQKQQLASPEQ